MYLTLFELSRMKCTCEDTYTLRERERETILLSLLDLNMLKSNDPSRSASAIASLENGFLLNEIFFHWREIGRASCRERVCLAV